MPVLVLGDWEFSYPQKFWGVANFFRAFQQQLSSSSTDTAAGTDDRRLHTNRITIHVHSTGSKWVGRLK